MLKNISIRLRVTIITILLLIFCCIGLTMVLNLSAYEMIKAVKTTEALKSEQKIGEKNLSDAISLNDSVNMKSTLNDERAYRTDSLLYMSCFIGFGGVLMYFIIYKALQPLNDLSNHIKNKSIENLSKKITLKNTRDEIYDLTVAFNEMTSELNEAFLMQKRFSNNAAHELRTPLAVMTTNLDVFKKKKDHTQEEYTNLIESMRSQLTRLSDLVSNLLQFTNMEDIDLSQDVRLKTLIKFICNDLYYVAEKKNIDIELLGDDVLIKGNSDLIYEAFYNLIENAIKYNKDRGSICIDIKEDKEIIVEIKDTGIGIPDDMKKHIFEPFFTVDKSRSRKLGGAGIGLSIVKSIIDRHKGIITIKNNKNIGTVFEIKFAKPKIN